MIEKNNVLVLQCIMSLIKCDLISAIKFAEHNQTCYNLAMAVANAKDEDAKTEKEALIDKACEWLKNNMYVGISEQMLSKKSYPFMRDFIEEFKQAMKGGKNE